MKRVKNPRSGKLVLRKTTLRFLGEVEVRKVEGGAHDPKSSITPHFCPTVVAPDE